MTPHERDSLFVILALAALAPLLSEFVPRFRPPIIVLELGLGVVIGPHVLGWVRCGPVIEVLANIGLAFLFFLAGLEINFRAISGRPLAAGAAGWALSLVLGLACGCLLMSSGLASSGLLVGSALTTTALGALIPILRDCRELETRFGAYAVAAGAAGEIGPIALIAAVLTTQPGGPGWSVGLLLVFVAVVVVAAFLASRARHPKLALLMREKMHTSAQLPLRLTVLFLAALVLLTEWLGLDAILGAFAAGVIVSAASPGEPGEALRRKVEGLGLGCVIPVFFIVTGARFDLAALLSSPAALAQLPLYLGLFAAVRGLPVLLWRGGMPVADRTALALLSATQLPLVVAITEIGVESRRMSAETASALVGAALVSVLLFPVLAMLLRRRSSQPVAAGEPGVIALQVRPVRPAEVGVGA